MRQYALIASRSNQDCTPADRPNLPLNKAVQLCPGCRPVPVRGDVIEIELRQIVRPPRDASLGLGTEQWLHGENTVPPDPPVACPGCRPVRRGVDALAGRRRGVDALAGPRPGVDVLACRCPGVDVLAGRRPGVDALAGRRKLAGRKALEP